MTTKEVMILVAIIKGYYPTKPMLDNPLEVKIWEKEFEKLNTKLAIKATRNVCNESSNGFDISIGKIKSEYYRLLKIQDETQIKTNPNSIPMPDSIKQQMIKDGLL